MTLSRDWYCEGSAVKNTGAVVAERTEETMELMLPVTEAEAAADWTAIAKEGMRELGKFWAARAAKAEERAGGEVLWEMLLASWCGRRQGMHTVWSR